MPRNEVCRASPNSDVWRRRVSPWLSMDLGIPQDARAGTSAPAEEAQGSTKPATTPYRRSPETCQTLPAISTSPLGRELALAVGGRRVGKGSGSGPSAVGPRGRCRPSSDTGPLLQTSRCRQEPDANRPNCQLGHMRSFSHRFPACVQHLCESVAPRRS